MRKSKKTSSLILAGLILSLIPVQPARGDIGIGIGIAIGSAVAGACAFIGWLCTPSTNKVIRRAEHAYHETVYRNKELINVFKTITTTEESPAQQRQAINAVSEDKLYDFAEALFSTHAPTSPDATLIQVKNSLRTLGTHKKKIQSRMKKVATKYGVESGVYLEMQALIQNIDTLHNELTLVRAFLTTHNSYFNLFHCEDNLLVRYQVELDALRNYEQDRHGLQQELRSCAMDKGQSTAHPGLIYQGYLATISADANALSNRIRALSGAYPRRREWCRKLDSSLHAARNTMLADPDCSMAIHDYEHAKATTALILTQGAIIATQGAIIAAERNNNEELRRENRIKQDREHHQHNTRVSHSRRRGVPETRSRRA